MGEDPKSFLFRAAAAQNSETQLNEYRVNMSRPQLTTKTHLTSGNDATTPQKSSPSKSPRKDSPNKLDRVEAQQLKAAERASKGKDGCILFWL